MTLTMRNDEDPEELRKFREQWRAEVGVKLRDVQPQQPNPASSSAPPVQEPIYSVEEILKGLEALHVESHALSQSKISKIVNTFPSETRFEHELEEEFSPLRFIPEEVILCVLRFLDHTSIERFASISRKARILTLDPSIWKDFVISTYKPPQIPTLDAIVNLVSLYSPDYRRLYVEQPRIRLDGVYIAVCRYIRPGLGDNAWVNITHLITYHRYLRFLPDGTVVSLLASDQTPPQEIIPLLDSSLRMKGLFIGNWELHGTTVYLTSLTDPSGHALRYVFQMTLQLRSKPIGRWNRLEFMAYDSVDLETGEAVPVSLKHETTPFLFSKVRSYHS